MSAVLAAPPSATASSTSAASAQTAKRLWPEWLIELSQPFRGREWWLRELGFETPERFAGLPLPSLSTDRNRLVEREAVLVEMMKAEREHGEGTLTTLEAKGAQVLQWLSGVSVVIGALAAFRPDAFDFLFQPLTLTHEFARGFLFCAGLSAVGAFISALLLWRPRVYQGPPNAHAVFRYHGTKEPVEFLRDRVLGEHEALKTIRAGNAAKSRHLATLVHFLIWTAGLTAAGLTTLFFGGAL